MSGRYIDADKFKDFMDMTCDAGGLMYPVVREIKEYVKKQIDAQPTADVVNVVRCKDCVYYHPSYCEIWSKYGTVQTRDQGFCYLGMRNYLWGAE